MTATDLIILLVIFFLTSIVGVVTGSNSLITVPAMFQFGIDEKVAVATNMFGLTFMAIGGTLPFVRAGKIDYRSVWPLAGLTAVASAIGAALVGLITNQSIKLIVVVAMIVVVIFTLLPKSEPPADDHPGGSSHPSSNREGRFLGAFRGRGGSLALALVFLLGIYGGLYSGGYVTILTPTLVAFYGMTYAESIGATKLINVFSSSIATAVFMWQGLVDYKLGVIIAIVMFAGAYAGAHYATKMNEIWLKRIFVATVFLLAIKTLYDFLN